jgi:hypothetical protein
MRKIREAKEAFRADLRRHLQRLSQKYEATVTSADHVQTIQDLADLLTKAHSAVLRGSRFRYGTAQKALNLYLKYRWCLGEIDVPPHCPFDSEIIRRVPAYTGASWTRMCTDAEYQALVEAATRMDGSTLAKWELELYNQIRRQKTHRVEKRMRRVSRGWHST